MNRPQAVRTEIVDRLLVEVFEDRRALGSAAAADVAAAIRDLQLAKHEVRIIFAAAPSQNETLASLINAPGIDWRRVTAFHMDEYIGLPADAPQGFSRFVQTRLFDRVKPGRVHLLDGTVDAPAECRRYADLLRAAPIDIVCLGIGENGHIAFNDPPVANFEDPETVKVVALDAACRRQQVNDGCFPSVAAVPSHAITLTIPIIVSAARLFCMVPGSTKREAVRRTLGDPVSTECPSTILRSHRDCTLYVDRDSYAPLPSPHGTPGGKG